MLKKINRFITYFLKFIVNPNYRNHVIDVIDRQVSRSEINKENQNQFKTKYNWLCKKSFFLIGGCELTYMKEWLEMFQVKTIHTFDFDRSPDPIVEISDQTSELWKSNSNYIILSQVQKFRNLVQKLQNEGESYFRDDQENDLNYLLDEYIQCLSLLRKKRQTPQ